MTPAQRMGRSDVAILNSSQQWRYANWGTLVPRGWERGRFMNGRELVPIRGRLMEEIHRRVREEIR